VAQSKINYDELSASKDDVMFFKSHPYTGYVYSTYPDKQLKMEGYYLNGKKDSTWKEYFSDGDLMSTYQCKSGKMSGFYREYHSGNSKILKLEGVYFNDIKNGTWSEYHSNGKLSQLFVYENGIIKDGPFISYHENGKIEKLGQYKNELMSDSLKYFDENGVLRSEGKMLEGKKIGVWKVFYSNGELMEEQTWETDEMIFKKKFERQKNSNSGSYGHGDGSGIGPVSGSGTGGGSGGGKGPGVGVGVGNGFDMTGRSWRKKPSLEDNSQETGKVVIEIVVDKNGNVIEANGPARGSTTQSPSLIKKAKEAALQAKFSPSAEGVEEQRGTITFDFRVR
jgi:TonB family protein